MLVDMYTTRRIYRAHKSSALTASELAAYRAIERVNADGRGALALDVYGAAGAQWRRVLQSLVARKLVRCERAGEVSARRAGYWVRGC